jgi:lipopolysaccharide biosynthesis glycosyltransferase
MYSRLLLPDILSEQEGRILYLDSDMLVLGDLRPLFALPLDGCVIGAVRDPAKPHNIAKRNRAIGNAEDAPYLNSGTLLIDIKKWKQDNVGTRCFEYLKSPGRKEFPDQDALNVVLAGKWKQIDRRWNFTEGENRLFSEEHFRQAYIIHFTGKKPNLAHCVHPAQTIYLDQRKKTPWANRPLVSNTRRRIHRLYRKLDLAWERYIVVPLRAPFRGS